MQRGTLWIAGVCGVVGLVAGRASAPARPIVVQAAPHATPIVVVAPPPRIAAAVAPAEPAEELADADPDADHAEGADEGGDDGGGTDLAAVLASLRDQAIAHPDRRAILGHITDGESNEPAIGATVVATSPNLVGEQVALTDESGAFRITDLPAGYYRLTIYYNDTTTERTDVASREVSATEVDIRVEPAPVRDFVRIIPTERTFEAVVGAAADPQDDDVGVSFSSRDTVENEYIIE